MLEKICERAQIQDGMEILDLGCGWGSCGLYLLKKYPNVKVTFFSNSTTQQAYIREQAKKGNNLDRIKVSHYSSFVPQKTLRVLPAM